jgi:hypothetical protein
MVHEAILEVTQCHLNIIYMNHVGRKINHLNFIMDMVTSFLVKFSTQCKVSGHHGNDNPMRILAAPLSPHRTPPSENKSKFSR